MMSELTIEQMRQLIDHKENVIVKMKLNEDELRRELDEVIQERDKYKEDSKKFWQYGIDLQRKLDEKLEIIDEQAETIANFAFDEQHLKAKLDIAKKALEEVIDWDNDPRIGWVRTAIEALKKLEE